MKKILQSTLIVALIVASFVAPIDAQAATNNIIVPQTTTDWIFVGETDPGNGVTGFEVGPSTPPLGTGSFFIQLNSAAAGHMLATQKYQGTRLSNITQLSYSTYTNQTPQAIAFQINYDPDITNTEATWYGRLVYEPYNNGTVVVNTWQTWDMLNAGNGRWWATNNGNSPVDNTCPQASPCTLATILSVYPNIGIRNDANSFILFKAGSNWNGFRGNVDNFTFATAADTDIYNFEYDVIVPTVVTDSLVATYSSGAGPSNFTVNFSENVDDPAGDSGTDDVTNPANYLLVEDGANGIFDTLSCAGGLTSDDTQVTVTGVTYNAGIYMATVTLSGAVPSGSYRLFVCGSTSIVDLAANALNGGTDYTFAFVVGTATTIPPTTPTVTASSLPTTGFAPNKITSLPVQPATSAYSSLGDIWLEIPSQNIKTNIVGVPQSEDSTWDVTWLGNDTGWLNGTAFPTWNGNSVLTAHVTDSNGLPGPFANIKELKYGDKVIVHLLGGEYTFEVQETRLSMSNSTNYAFRSIQDHSYLTLITCQGYNPFNESYLFRRIVRAVLVEVK